MRLVKIDAVGSEIFLTVVMDREPDEQIQADISLAGTEIIADFSEAAKIYERFEVTVDPIPKEDLFAHGWVFLRAGEGY
jgi:hypothetical protein